MLPELQKKYIFRYFANKNNEIFSERFHQHHFYCNRAPLFLNVGSVNLALSKNGLYFIFLFWVCKTNCFKMNIFIIIKLLWFECCVVFHLTTTPHAWLLAVHHECYLQLFVYVTKWTKWAIVCWRYMPLYMCTWPYLHL